MKDIITFVAMCVLAVFIAMHIIGPSGLTTDIKNVWLHEINTHNTYP